MRGGKRTRSARSASFLYDAVYFDTELHRHHWFTNNARKRERRWREVLRMLEPCATDRVLEIGCGAGAHTLSLASLVAEGLGIDSAHAGVIRATRAAAEAGVDNAYFLQADAAELPLGDLVVDKIAAIDFVEHVDDTVLTRVLTEAHRVLRPGGTLAIYTPNASHYVEALKARDFLLHQIPGHVAVRDAQAYVRMLEAGGWEVRRIWFSPSDYPVFGTIDRVLAGVPGLGRWFRFRICMVACKSAQPGL